MNQERFAIDDVAGHNLPDGTVVARNRRSGRQVVLPAQIFNAISYCDQFRTMEEHIAHLSGPNAGGREHEIRQILQTVINGGLMISAGAICNTLTPSESSAPQEPPLVAVTTCNRPEALARLLASMAAHCNLEMVHQVVIIDDSRGEEMIAANRAVIDRVNDDLQARGLKPLRHFTPADAGAMADTMCERLPAHETGIRHLLDRRGKEHLVTTGIARNMALVMSVGRPLLFFDDDTLCTVMDPPHRSGGVEFSARQRDCRFYESNADWAAQEASEDPGCPLTRHLQALGNTLTGSLTSLAMDKPTPDAFMFTRTDFAARIRPGSRILVSQCGCYGDPGSGGNEWVALVPTEIRAQLAGIVGNPGASELARNCWLGQSRPVYQSRANMTQLTGVDNRHYMPPYYPIFRDQDRVFGAMTEFLHPNDLAVDLPFALPHLPMPHRRWKDFERGVNLPFSLRHFFHDHIVSQVGRCGAVNSADRNNWLAGLFDDLAASPRQRIIEQSAQHWTQRRIDWLTQLSGVLDSSAGTPVPMEAYFRQLLNGLQARNITDFSRAEFEGPPADLDSEGLLEYWRDAWRAFGAGLRAWPYIREEALTLAGS